jgi:hypothetical protein
MVECLANTLDTILDTSYYSDMKLTRTDVESAAQYLGIEVGIDAVTLAEVRAAFATALRNAHPDTSGKTAFDAADVIATLRAARDMLTEWVSRRPDPNCRLCSGSGHVRGIGFSSRPCPRCA